MSENRNTLSGLCQDNRGMVCVDTNRVLDSCRDRDCFENTRVYLTAEGEGILTNGSNLRARSAKILWAYIGVNEVPFNCGFYQVSIRYYVGIELESCLGLGRSQTFKGLALLEKEVILYGGEGNVTTFTSDPENDYCSLNLSNRGTNNPVATVETVEPIILGTKIVEPGCQCNHCCGCSCDCNEFPSIINDFLCGEIANGDNAPKLYITFGVFSVIRITRPAQMLVQATDYSVPDKECVAATNDENPCAAFEKMPFPATRFRGTSDRNELNENNNGRHPRSNCCGNR